MINGLEMTLAGIIAIGISIYILVLVGKEFAETNFKKRPKNRLPL